MIKIPIDIRYLEGFDFFDILLPCCKKKNNKLILKFSTIGVFLDYQDYLLTLLKELRNDQTLSLDMAKQHKVKFVKQLLMATMSKTVAVILKQNWSVHE